MSDNKKMTVKWIRSLIRDVPDFPKPGILFKDITTLLKNASAFRFAIGKMASKFKNAQIEQVIGIESRGFIFSSALAIKLKTGFVPVRKKGKLPAKTESMSYALEYGEDSLEVHVDAIQEGTSVIIVDDLLATGGTAEAVIKLVEKLGGKVVGLAFLIELTFLKGRERLKGYPVHSLITF